MIGEADGNIDNIKMTNRVPDYTEMLIDLEVWDLKHLNDIIAGLAGQGHGLERRAGEQLRSSFKWLQRKRRSTLNSRGIRTKYGRALVATGPPSFWLLVWVAHCEVVMLFRRREAESFAGARCACIFGRGGAGAARAAMCVYRLRRLSDTPHAVALGFAVGVFSALTPFLGTHMVMAALIAWVIGGSVVAALLGTFVGNPLTYPLFWYSTYEVGNLMLARARRRSSTSTSPAASFSPRSISFGRS